MGCRFTLLHLGSEGPVIRHLPVHCTDHTCIAASVYHGTLMERAVNYRVASSAELYILSGYFTCLGIYEMSKKSVAGVSLRGLFAWFSIHIHHRLRPHQQYGDADLQQDPHGNNDVAVHEEHCGQVDSAVVRVEGDKLIQPGLAGREAEHGCQGPIK
jgi:hypothetical protein